jgi:hypothetical protein
MAALAYCITWNLFQTAQDRLVKGLRVAGAATLEQANAYLEAEFMVSWNHTIAVVPASTGPWARNTRWLRR